MVQYCNNKIVQVKKSATRGSVLLESLIAITVLTVGMLGIFSLLSRSVGLTRVIANQYIGAHLAAEGIELVKNVVDTNMLVPRAWNAGLASGVYEVAYNTGLEQDNNRTLFYDNSTGLYDYAGGDAPTTFQRKIELTRIGANELQVNSRVAWTTRGGGEFNVDLEDRFFRR